MITMIIIFLSRFNTNQFTRFNTNQFNDLLPIVLLALLVERCIGIAEVKGSNPVQAWIFSDFLFTTTKVASITAMIIFHLIFISVFSLQAHYIRGLLVSADGTWDTVPSLGLKAYLWTCTCECGPIFPLSKLQVHAQLLSLGRINFEWRGGIGWLFPQQMCDQQWFLS